MYIVLFLLEISESYFTTWMFRYVDFQSVSEVYLESFDTCVRQCYFSLVLIHLITLISIGIVDGFVSLFPLVLNLYRFFIRPP